MSEMKEKFAILDERQHVLLRSEMYLGGITPESRECFLKGEYKAVQKVPGLLKIINEIIDNTVDEAIRTNFTFANLIKVTMTDKFIQVEDNGRGIPIEDIHTPEGTVIPRPVAAWTRARAGSNFEDDGRIAIGMNGVGSFCTNVFSKRFHAKTDDGVKKLSLTSINNAESNDYTITDSNGARGTSVKFWPDLEKFHLETIDVIHQDIIEDRLQSLAACFPKISFRFNGKLIRHRNLKQYAEIYTDNYVANDSDTVSFFVYGGDKGFRQNSFVNGVQTINGGSHVDYVMQKLVEVIRPAVEKAHKIDVSPLQVRSHLQLVLLCREFEGPVFDSQTKERLTNKQSSVNQYFSALDINWDRIAKKILKTPEIINPMIDALLAKKALAEKRALDAAKKKAKKKKTASHLAASSRVTSEKIIFFTEGDCLHEDTNIKVFDNGLCDKQVKDVNVGDKVLSHDGSINQISAVTKVLKKSYTFTTNKGNLQVSPNHKLFVYDTTDNEFKWRIACEVDKTCHKLVRNRLADMSASAKLVKISEGKKHDLFLEFADGFTLDCSLTHEFLVESNDTDIFVFVEAKDLVVGDFIVYMNE